MPSSTTSPPLTTPLSGPHSRSKSSERQTFSNVIKLKFYTLWLWDGKAEICVVVQKDERYFWENEFEEKEISRDYLQNGSLCCCLFVDILVPVPETTLKFENITVKLTEIN